LLGQSIALPDASDVPLARMSAYTHASVQEMQAVWLRRGRATLAWCPIPFDPNRPNGVFLPFVHLPRGMSRTSQSQQPKSFEAALAELEEIVHAMEAGQLPLEQTIAAYRRGAQLLQFCQNALKDAAQQVKLLDAGVLRDFSVDGESAVADGRD